MNIEFHYYMVYLLAKRSGFNDEESYVTAYSSQYVDHNTARIKIKGEDGEYKNYISQTIDITKPKKKLMRIYPCFHFIPGDYDCDSAKRKDGKLHVLNTTPGSKNANVLMDEALSTKDLFRIGVCTHCYADTWAHQNFAGYFDYFNARGGVLETLTPNIGHADAQTQPDIPGLVWEDEGLISANREIHNNKRLIEAAESIFKKFKAYINPKQAKNKVEEEWRAIKTELENAVGDEFRDKDQRKKERIASYKKLLKNSLADFKDYDKNAWFDEAIRTKVVGWKDRKNWGPLNKINIFPDKYYKKSGFESSHWYKFQEAIKEHQRFANKLYSELYYQLEVEEY